MTAVEELKAQKTRLAARGRRLFFDFVVEAPSRFSREVKAAAEAISPQIGTAVCCPRFNSLRTASAHRSRLLCRASARNAFTL